MNKTALSLLLCDGLGKLKRRTRPSRCTLWEPWVDSFDQPISLSKKYL